MLIYVACAEYKYFSQTVDTGNYKKQNQNEDERCNQHFSMHDTTDIKIEIKAVSFSSCLLRNLGYWILHKPYQRLFLKLEVEALLATYYPYSVSNTSIFTTLCTSL